MTAPAPPSGPAPPDEKQRAPELEPNARRELIDVPPCARRPLPVNGELARCERAVVASAYENFLSGKALSPIMHRVIDQAPDSLRDPQLAAIAAALRDAIRDGLPITRTVIASSRHLQKCEGAHLLLDALALDAVGELAEFDAEIVWADYRNRRAMILLQDGLDALEEHPDRVESILAHAQRELEQLRHEAILGMPLLPLWRPSQFLTWTEPKNSHLLLPSYLSREALSALVAQAGIGKTRLALWLAICQILKRLWCGLRTGGDPVKWVFLGDENSVARWKTDLEHIFASLTTDEIEQVEEFLRLQAITGLDDAGVWLGDAKNRERIGATLQAERPGVVVGDPFASFAPGDISKPGEMREAVRLFSGTIRRGAPQAALVAVHHARTGRGNIVQGVGWDAANFSLGGKALFSAARCVMNLMPGRSDDDTRLVLHCAKANNCERFTTRGIIFNTQTFIYDVDPDFDEQAWIADVEGRAKTGQSLCTVAEVTAAVRDGYGSTKALVDHLTDTFATSRSTIERLIRRAVDCDAIKPLTRGKFLLGKKSEKFLEPTT